MITREKIEHSARDMASRKDSAILGEISRVIGQEANASSLAAMKCRIIVAKFPNGVEQYQLDGVPIVEFYPMESNTKVDENSTYHVSVTQKYRVLTPARSANETPCEEWWCE